MTPAALTRPLLHTAGAAETVRVLEAALAGGPAVAPLPEDPVQAQQALQMLRPADEVEVDDIAAVVSTSGSTGAPKGVMLSRRAMLASIEATHHRLGGRGRWLLALPVHYVAGLMVAARSLFSGTDPLPVGSDLAGLREPGLLGGASRYYLSIVPTQLFRALADPVLTEALSRLDAVLVGGGPADPGVVERARSAGVNVVATYGMSETCGGCVYDGVPLTGVDLAVEEDGRVSISGSMLFSGYRLRPDLTAAVLAGRRLRTSDRGRVVDGRLEVLGRVDDVVVSGGHNVDLAAVESALRSSAVVAGTGAEVVVLAVADEEWGTAVVVVTDAQTTLEEMVEGAGDRLGASARPRRLIRLAGLPRTGSGKVDRPALQHMITLREPGQSPASA